ncbi:MAG: UDP-N-acetylmuramoyl-tripeptide--D-alanyl-D-alanine ligase [Actinomycetia bacterium]|nr:UDP-N-acetylmuramoyl-tripeptide--D-alanyl-D-alanine ligase [Actinomycetes bacterium]
MPVTVTLADAVGWAGGRLSGVDPAAAFAGATVDSRSVQPGQLFVALPGTRTHGRRFAADAVRQGARVVLAEGPPLPDVPHWVHDAPLEALGTVARRALARVGARVVGITGSVGKTSTKTLVAAVLRQDGPTQATPKNFNTAIGLPLAMLDLEPGTRWFVAEMGMRGPGEIRALVRLAPPTVAVITNVGTAHLERLGSVAAIREAKAEILEGLGRDGVAVLNAADEAVWSLRDRVAGRVVGYGRSDQAVWADDVATRPGSVRFRLHGPDGTFAVTLPWDGAHQVANACAAAAVGYALGLDGPRIVRGLESVDPAPHFRRLAVGGITVLDDSYNASPASMAAGLALLAAENGRRVAVLGDMLELGPVEASAHREMGEAAARAADVVLAVGPRARMLYEAARAAGAAAAHVEDAAAAVRWLKDHVRAGDVIYVKGSRAVGLDAVVQALAGDGPAP